MNILFWDTATQSWVVPAAGQTIDASFLPAATPGAAPRYAASLTTLSTNANLVVAAGVSYSLPAATLTANRTIDLTAINTNGDYIEIDNQEAGFTWTFIGGTVYDAYENIVTILTANTRYILRRSNGKIKIIN